MKRLSNIFVIAALLSILFDVAHGQGATMKWRSATSLPGSCVSGTAVTAADSIIVNSVPYVCVSGTYKALFYIDASQTLTGKLTLFTSTTSAASMNIPSGTDPTACVSGDFWSTGASLKICRASTPQIVETREFKNAASGYAGLDSSSRIGKLQGHAATVYNDQANTFGAFAQIFQGGANFSLVDPTDTTKKLQFDISGVSTGTTRTMTVPNANGTFVVPDTGAANNFLTAISAAGAITKAQPSSANLSDVGTLVKNNAGNAYTTGAQDFTSATSLTVPTASGASPTSNGQIAFDNTNSKYAFGGTIGASSTAGTGFMPRFFTFLGASTTVTATVTETVFSTSTGSLPANFFTVGKIAIVYTEVQDVSGASPVTRKYQLRLQKGGATNVYLYTPAAAAPTASSTRSAGMIFFIRCVSTGTSGTVDVGMVGTGSTAASVVVNTVTQPVTIDTTAAQTVQLTQTLSATTAGETSQMRFMMLGELN
jgi:hypothetical protein